MSLSSPDRPDPVGRRLRLGASVAAVALAANPASPIAAQTVPELTASGAVTYSPNPLLLPGEDRGAVLTEVTVASKLSVTTVDQSELALSGTLGARQYSRLYGNVLFGEARVESTYRDSEYLSVFSTGLFRRAPLIDRLTTSVDAGLDPGAVSNTLYGRLGVRWNPDAYTTITPDFEAEQTRYAESSVLRATRVLRGGLAISRRTGPSTTLGIRGGGRFSMVGEFDATTLFLDATAEAAIARNWRASAELGVERNSAQSGDIAGTPFHQPTRYLVGGRGSLCSNGERSEACVRAGLFSEVSGIGGLQRRTFVNGSLREALGQRTDLRLLGEYQRTTMGGGDLPTTDTYRAAATVERALVPTLSLGGTLEYFRRKLAFSRAIDAVFVGVTLRFTPRLR